MYSQAHDTTVHAPSRVAQTAHYALIYLCALLSSCVEAQSDAGPSGGEPLQPIYVAEFDFEGLLEEPDQWLDDPCDPTPCALGARCVIEGDEPRCLALSCEQLSCAEGEACQEPEEGSGASARCVPSGCVDDEGCPLDEHCVIPSGERFGGCRPDLCAPSERRCDGAFVELCDERGAGFNALYQCSLDRSVCEERLDAAGLSEASCLCEDAWDCPAPMRCVQGSCQGRPEPASCLLEPAPFEASLPSPEIVWGGAAGVEPSLARAEGSPFPESVQVVMTPLVVNLNDDTGDGVIDERDSPDILFMSFCGRSFREDGALRAIHGGGPRKGRDLWARLGPHLWREGEPLPAAESYSCEEADLDSTAAIAAADLDEPSSSDGRVELLALHESDGLHIYSNEGELIAELLVGQMPAMGPNPAISIANLDGEGMAEAVIGRLVFQFKRDPSGRIELAQLFEGSGAKGTNGQGSISCVADLDGDGRAEVIAGGTAYTLPRAPRGLSGPEDCVAQGGAFEPQTLEEDAWCSSSLLTLWDIMEVNPSVPRREGFCAVSDLWGADPSQPPGPNNPLDGLPEVALISDGALFILSGVSGQLLSQFDVGSNNDRGGAPNVDDFDGDGFPEVGSAFAQGYRMMDLQPPSPSCPAWDALIADGDDEAFNAQAPRLPGPSVCERDADCVAGEATCAGGRCVCLHNGWQRATEDDSSKVTGSTLFDFNGDGASEVIYNDECFFRIYDGSTGQTLFKDPSESRTRIEHPIVADVDNDGNAEIIFSTSTESTFCGVRNQTDAQDIAYREYYNPGLEVWGDPQDRWVSARRVWSQHAYHITHVTESGRVPLREPRGWGAEAEGRSYNSYRSQPRSYGIAPDLIVERLELVTESACGEGSGITLNASILNQGDVRVGEGIRLAFEGEWAGERRALADPQGRPLELRTPVGLDPDARLPLRVSYQPLSDPTLSPAQQATPPERVWAIIDLEEGSDFGRERECDEGNNERSAELNEREERLAELRVEVLELSSDYCPNVTLNLLIHNEGAAPAQQVTLSLYQGDPLAGGARLDRVTLPSFIPPGSSLAFEWLSDRLPYGREVQLWVAIDPANLIPECAEDNNLGAAPRPIRCIERDGG